MSSYQTVEHAASIRSQGRWLVHALHDTLPLGMIAALGALASLPVAVAFFVLVERPSQRLARWVAERLRTPAR